MKAIATIPLLLLGALLAFLAILPSCSTAPPPPRTTTERERAMALETLQTAETALVVLQAAGKITAEDNALAMEQLAQLRADVESSATTPVAYSDLLHRVIQFGARWAMPQAPPPAPPPGGP